MFFWPAHTPSELKNGKKLIICYTGKAKADQKNNFCSSETEETLGSVGVFLQSFSGRLFSLPVLKKPKFINFFQNIFIFDKARQM